MRRIRKTIKKHGFTYVLWNRTLCDRQLEGVRKGSENNPKTVSKPFKKRTKNELKNKHANRRDYYQYFVPK